MNKSLIQLEDKTLVEVEIPEDKISKISGGIFHKVDSTFDKIKPIILNICNPITEICHVINQKADVENFEIKIGFSFEGEGNLYITKGKAEANLEVTITVKPNNNHTNK